MALSLHCQQQPPVWSMENGSTQHVLQWAPLPKEPWDSQTPWPSSQLPGFNMILRWVFLRVGFARRLQRVTPPGTWSCTFSEPHTPRVRCWLPALQLEAAPVPQGELSSPLHHHLSLWDKHSDQRISNNHIKLSALNFSPSRTGSFPVQVTAGSSATKDAICLVLLGGWCLLQHCFSTEAGTAHFITTYFSWGAPLLTGRMICPPA